MCMFTWTWIEFCNLVSTTKSWLKHLCTCKLEVWVRYAKMSGRAGWGMCFGGMPRQIGSAVYMVFVTVCEYSVYVVLCDWILCICWSLWLNTVFMLIFVAEYSVYVVLCDCVWMQCVCCSLCLNTVYMLIFVTECSVYVCLNTVYDYVDLSKQSSGMASTYNSFIRKKIFVVLCN